jgi:hypothetical protein
LAFNSVLCALGFPVRPQIFPALAASEFGSQTIELPRESRGALALSSPKSANFPVSSLGTGKQADRDGFADDCRHRQMSLIYNRYMANLKFAPQIAPQRSSGTVAG